MSLAADGAARDRDAAQRVRSVLVMLASTHASSVVRGRLLSKRYDLIKGK